MSGIDDMSLPVRPRKEMPRSMMDELHRRLAEARDKELIALIEDPERDAWLDGLNEDDIIEGAAHVGVFVAETVRTIEEE